MLKAAFFAIGALLATPALAASSVLYGSDSTSLYRVDTATGAATLVGSHGLSGFDSEGYGAILRDLTASGTTLYGAKYIAAQSGITSEVVTINAATGAVISSVAVTGLVETGFNRSMNTVAFDSATNTLYGTTARRLYSIDALTGAASFLGMLPSIGNFGLTVGGASNGLYLVSDFTDASNVDVITLYELSKVDGSVLFSSSLTNNCGCDIAFDPLTQQGFISSVFYNADKSAVLYGGLDQLNGTLSGTSFVGQHSAGTLSFNGIAFFGSAVPEPTSWAMMITGFGLSGAAMRRRRDRAKGGLARA